MKILTVLGARPQFIKAATISRVFKQLSIDERIFHSGQHYDFNMSDIFFQEMEIPEPHYKHILQARTHGKMTAEIISALEDIVLAENFDAIMVYGDTNTTIAGALVGAKLNIPVIHVESGLRSFNKKMPEEVNRVLTDHVSSLLFCPTETARINLANESITNGVYVVGDVMYDALLYYKSKSKKVTTPSEFILATIHRQENTDDIVKLKNIITAFKQIAIKKNIVLPLHPRTRKIITENNIDVSDINIMDPVGYFEMLYLLEHASAVITDSGGLQKEAYLFNKPLLIIRDETEWVELVEHNHALLAGTDDKKILDGYNKLNTLSKEKTNFYGDGHAAEKIVGHIIKFFK